MSSILELAQERLANALLEVQGQLVTIARGSGSSSEIIYSGLGVVAPLLDDSNLDGGYRAGFDSCSVTIPATVNVKRGDLATLDSGGQWKIAPGEHTIHKCDGYNQLQKVTFIRSSNATPSNRN